MLCGWEGNHRSGVALVNPPMDRAHGLRKGDDNTAYTSYGVWHTLPYLTLTMSSQSGQKT